MMRNVIIYKSELQDGLADKIRANSSISCAGLVESCNLEEYKEKFLISVASEINEDEILYPIKSILVTTNCNKNNDIFLKEETWAAKDTPRHKPTNLNHKKSNIVGHITDTWAIDFDGNIIPADTAVEDLPDFHICNGSVIYKYFPGDDEMTAQAEQLIAEIEAGTKYVSMECLFPSFDYGLYDGDKIKIVRREASSAFLTKYLRQYGGEGEFNGRKIGRVLRNIEFSGKGFVDKPANPDSIIFDSKTKTSQATVINVSLEDVKVEPVEEKSEMLITSGSEEPETKTHTENTSMEEKIQAELTAAKESIAELTKTNKELVERLANESVAKFEAEITELKAEVTSTKEANAGLQTKVVELETSLTEANDKVVEVTKVKDELETKVKDAEASAIKSVRISTLVEGGIAKEDAAAKVEKFITLSNEQFEEIAVALIAAVAKVEDTGSENDEDILKNAKAEEAGDLGATETDDPSETKKQLMSGLAAEFGKFLIDDSEQEDK